MGHNGAWQVREPLGRDWPAEVVGAPSEIIPTEEGPLHVVCDGICQQAQRCSNGVVRFASALAASATVEFQLCVGDAPQAGTPEAGILRRSVIDDQVQVEGDAVGIRHDASGTLLALRDPAGEWREASVT